MSKYTVETLKPERTREIIELYEFVRQDWPKYSPPLDYLNCRAMADTLYFDAKMCFCKVILYKNNIVGFLYAHAEDPPYSVNGYYVWVDGFVTHPSHHVGHLLLRELHNWMAENNHARIYILSDSGMDLSRLMERHGYKRNDVWVKAAV